jgi:general secretion pathway protein A
MEMYQSYFGLSENPFSLTPDPRFLFLSTRHREGIAHLIYGIGRGGGFVQITGEVGTGKTTLYRSVLARAHKNVDVALILNPCQSAVELLASICDELHVNYDKRTNSIKTLVDALNRHLLKVHTKGRRTVLIIDEAQNLEINVLEQIRLLTNLETAKQKLLQIVLIGQPELQELLQRPDLRQLKQRITARYHLTPLSETETNAYVHHRLSRAGRTTPLFTPAALKTVHRLSGGVPRLTNIICERSLLAAYALQSQQIGPGIVRKAAIESTGKESRWPLQAAAVIAGLAVFGTVLALLTHLEAGYNQSTASLTPATVTGTAASAESQIKRNTIAMVEAVPANNTETGAATSQFKHDTATSGDTTPTQNVAAPVAVNNINARSAKSAVTLPSSLRDELRSGKYKTDTTTAFSSLFRLWGLDYNTLPGNSVCARAEAGGLSCMVRRGSLSSVRLYERPSVLDLFDNYGNLHRATVVQLSDDRATLDFGGEHVSVSTAKLESAWLGSYVLLWRPPKISTTRLHEGIRGPDVVWLRKQLDRAENKSTTGVQSPVFDTQLTQRVVSFQRSHGIPADGIVGQQTLLKLNSVTANPPVPLLSQATR